MSLSNTATPKYYGLFRDAVQRGDKIVNREVSMQMCLIDAIIEDPNFYYDSDAITGYVAFCETELTLANGEDLTLLDTFILWAEDVLSWFYFIEQSVFVSGENEPGGHYETRRVKKRLRNKQFIVLGRGGAKTMYCSTIQNFFLNVDSTTNQQFTTAPTIRQADEVLAPIRTSIARSRGPLFSFLTEGSIRATSGNRTNRAKLASTKIGIQNFVTGSTLKAVPMTIDKLQGFQPKITTVDEWLSGDVREDVIGAIEQGAAKNKDWLIIAVSSEGTVRNSVGDSIKMELMDILRGDYYNPHVSIWYYRLDDISEVNDPRMWQKAQPNIDKTVSYETYSLEVERAERVPSTRNDILAKRFGIPLEGYTYFFTYEETLCHPKRNFWRMLCAMGADMSQGDDFCSFSFLFPLRAGFGVKSRCYISYRTLCKLSVAMRQKYETFIDEGSLIIMDGTTLDMMDVYDDLVNYISMSEYDVRAFGYDPYNAQAFVERWIRTNGEYGVLKVPQGARTESVPLGELKKLAEDRLLIFDQDIMSYTMGNAITLEDTNGNRKLYKKRADQKVDCVASTMDALIAYKNHQEYF